jgi:hypothetical protein
MKRREFIMPLGGAAGVAARGTRAAGGDAGDRPRQRSVARGVRACTTRCFESRGGKLKIQRSAGKTATIGTSSAQYLVDRIFVQRRDQNLPYKFGDI